MKTLFLDTFSGISGDMFLGLLLDLGLSLADLEAELQKLPVDGYRLELKTVQRQAITGSKLTVHCKEQHHHRTWSGIDRMLMDSDLASPVKELARRIFRRIGEAEARIHGVALETVHFHEVGALDSIVDIVGAAIGLHLLGNPQVACTPLPMTRGTVRCAHGSFPLPAPATLEILNGLPIVHDFAGVELVTPTGAAIAAEIATFGTLPSMILGKTGYGAGERELRDRPNLLRGLLGETGAEETLDRDRVAILETHLDDANPEWLGALMDSLLTAGAFDVGYNALQMKKNRPGLALTVIAPPHLSEQLARIIMRESSAGGVRWRESSRYKLHSEPGTVTTNLGKAQVKHFYEGDVLLRSVPEYESCRQLAIDCGLPLPEVYRLVERGIDAAKKNRP
ncbi:TIGR00299 family protein [Syntrophotalea acetylenivorans]|uniref:Putative nickel insertion protein n=1 Tax=Syntrophotalea acetylenivorans TaxID=1842532 RepID=A0A1L3GSH8_9BACT|nr:nickel pincer cofactor biosynthesis protein LarC [Syntrophotalea acetylenivorans]APG28820.1 TIGR00299 family protein [Syntrophotalea acetylenivorans]